MVMHAASTVACDVSAAAMPCHAMPVLCLMDMLVSVPLCRRPPSAHGRHCGLAHLVDILLLLLLT